LETLQNRRAAAARAKPAEKVLNLTAAPSKVEIAAVVELDLVLVLVAATKVGSSVEDLVVSPVTAVLPVAVANPIIVSLLLVVELMTLAVVVLVEVALSAAIDATLLPSVAAEVAEFTDEGTDGVNAESGQ
jgi:hypothetical protein